MVKKIALKCYIERGGFSCEKRVRINAKDGTYNGVAPAHLCWYEDGRPVEQDGPDGTVRGMVAGRVVEHYKEGYSLVNVASAHGTEEIYCDILTSELCKRPLEKAADTK